MDERLETVNQAGTYGTKGFPRTYTEPGARNGGTCWIDKNGNFWLFGGYGCSTNNAKGYLNDLWRYNPDTNMWTWVSGTQYINQAGIYGIKGTPNAANTPGGRSRGGWWIDNDGNFWIFGGFGFDATASLETLGELNDLWRYDSVTNRWTWTSGSNRIKQAGTYGTKGTPDARNVPGARGNSVCCGLTALIICGCSAGGTFLIPTISPLTTYGAMTLSQGCGPG